MTAKPHTLMCYTFGKEIVQVVLFNNKTLGIAIFINWKTWLQRKSK